MKRRDFFALTGAGLAVSAMPALAAADYTKGLVKKHLAAGDTVFLEFKTSWCTTCAAQERVLDKLKAANPDYEAKIVFINVDWDQYGRSDLVKELRVPRRSTLVALKGDQEIGRLVADTNAARIKTLVDNTLAAATA